MRTSECEACASTPRSIEDLDLVALRREFSFGVCEGGFTRGRLICFGGRGRAARGMRFAGQGQRPFEYSPRGPGASDWSHLLVERHLFLEVAPSVEATA